MNPLDQLDRLLGSDMQPLIEPITGAREVVQRELESNRIRFEQWLSRHSFKRIDEVREFFVQYIERVESELSKDHDPDDLTNADGMRAAIQDLQNRQPRGSRLGIFLTEDAAKSLLHLVPPEGLLRNTFSQDLSALFARISPLQCIALTRHTESKEWQNTYLSALALLTDSSFEEREVKYFTVDAHAYAQALTAAGRPLKPWRMSHSKEAGIITCFTHDREKSLHTPRFIFAALMFHYTEEILRAAHALRQLPLRATGQGQYISAIIRSTQRKLPYFSPNMHSEALYWENALKQLDSVYPALGIKEFIPFLTCGEFLETASRPLSLNLIDHLWNANFNSENAEYFKIPTDDFVYHFREAFWGEVLRRLRKLTPDEMSHAIFHALDIDDVEFTKIMLEKALLAPSLKSRATRLLIAIGRPISKLLPRPQVLTRKQE